MRKIILKDKRGTELSHTDCRPFLRNISKYISWICSRPISFLDIRVKFLSLRQRVPRLFGTKDPVFPTDSRWAEQKAELRRVAPSSQSAREDTGLRPRGWGPLGLATPALGDALSCSFYYTLPKVSAPPVLAVIWLYQNWPFL